jgi:hypothetical protein
MKEVFRQTLRYDSGTSRISVRLEDCEVIAEYMLPGYVTIFHRAGMLHRLFGLGEKVGFSLFIPRNFLPQQEPCRMTVRECLEIIERNSARLGHERPFGHFKRYLYSTAGDMEVIIE